MGAYIADADEVARRTRDVVIELDRLNNNLEVALPEITRLLKHIADVLWTDVRKDKRCGT